MQFNIILFHIYFLVQIQLIKPSTGRRGKAKGTTRDDEAEKRNNRRVKTFERRKALVKSK